MIPIHRSLRTPSILVPSLALLLLAGCGTESRLPTSPAPAVHVAPAGERQQASRDLLAEARSAQSRYGDALLDLFGVIGSGVEVGADGRPLIRVYVARSGLRVPSQLAGVRVEQEVAGEFTPTALTGRYRPIALGVSVGNAGDCIPGTIGAVVAKGSRRYLLSCSHVLARQNAAALGETVVQPARFDASSDCSPSPATDAVAVLSDYQPLDFAGGNNTYDAAIAELTLPASNITCATLPGYYGSPGAAPVAGTAGLAVLKVGRTTELTRGSIKAIDVKIKITYPAGVARFSGVMLTSKDFGAYGDSGSLVVTDDASRSPVGLLFSGDALGRGVVCPIAPVLARFGATICVD